MKAKFQWYMNLDLSEKFELAVFYSTIGAVIFFIVSARGGSTVSTMIAIGWTLMVIRDAVNLTKRGLL